MAFEKLHRFAAPSGARQIFEARAAGASAGATAGATGNAENTGDAGVGDTSGTPAWSRVVGNGYEVSSAGDSRFSALHARLADGRTIEEAYQLDVKGYREQGNDWRLGKGKPPLVPMSADEQWLAYRALWEQWGHENPALVEELRGLARGKTLTDRFAATPVSQARALAEILASGEARGEGGQDIDGNGLNALLPSKPGRDDGAFRKSAGIDFSKLNDPAERAKSKLAMASRSAEYELLVHREKLAMRFLRQVGEDQFDSRERSFLRRAEVLGGGMLSEPQSKWLLDLAARHGWVDPKTLAIRRLVFATHPDWVVMAHSGDGRSGSDGDAPPCWLAFDLDRALLHQLEICRALIAGGDFEELAQRVNPDLKSNTLTTGEVLEGAAGDAYPCDPGQVPAFLMRVNRTGFWFEGDGVVTAQLRHGEFNEFYWSGRDTGFFADGRSYCGENPDVLSALYVSELRERQRESAGDQPGEQHGE